MADKVKHRLNERIGGVSGQMFGVFVLGPAGMGEWIFPYVLVKVKTFILVLIK